MVAEDDGEQCGNEGKQGKLDIPNPEIGLGAFEDHLEVDTCEPGRETCGCDRAEALEWTHDVDVYRCSVMGAANGNVDRLVWSTAGRGGLDLNDSDPQGEETKGHPLRGG